IAHIDAQRFYEVQKNLTLTGHVFTVYIPVVSEMFFSSLPEEQQKLLRDAMAETEIYQQELVDSEEAGQLQKIREAGVEVVELTPEQQKKFVEQTESVRAAYRDEVGPEVFDSWVAAVAAETDD
ncbi:MAG: TRAP transporter substrate-binding protein, partial [Hyphomicrobiaceae bacterium]